MKWLFGVVAFLALGAGVFVAASMWFYRPSPVQTVLFGPGLTPETCAATISTFFEKHEDTFNQLADFIQAEGDGEKGGLFAERGPATGYIDGITTLRRQFMTSFDTDGRSAADEKKQDELEGIMSAFGKREILQPTQAFLARVPSDTDPGLQKTTGTSFALSPGLGHCGQPFINWTANRLAVTDVLDLDLDRGWDTGDFGEMSLYYDVGEHLKYKDGCTTVDVEGISTVKECVFTLTKNWALQILYIDILSGFEGDGA